MILAINIENTNIVIGCLNRDRILFMERLSTDKKKTALEYAMSFKAIFELHEVDRNEIEGAIIASVVPPVLNQVSGAVRKLTGKTALVVGPGVKTGLNIKMDDPRSVGSDLIVAAVSAIDKYGAPLIIIDMGTATTMSVVDRNKCYIGGVITPGAALSMEALATRTALLQKIGMDKADHVICKNTIDAINSGLLVGAACTVDGMIDRMEEELGYKTTVLATGPDARRIIPLCKHDIIIDKDIIMHGLRIIYEKNRQA